MKPVNLRLRLTLRQTASFGVLLLLFACAPYAMGRGPGLLFVMTVLIAVYGAIEWVASGRRLRSISALGSAADEISACKLKRRFPSVDCIEHEQLACSLNAMIGRLEESFQQLQEFSPNVSHELRRPLTNLRAEAENALRHSHNIEEYRAVLARQLEQVDLISATMSDLLELARFGSQSSKPNKQDQNLSELIEASVEAMLPSAQAQKVELTANVASDIFGAIDTWQICRVLQNVIDNAIKYSASDGRVHVNAFQENSSTVIVISDNGKGIPADDLPKIFDRTFRSQSARTSCIQGSGLGLYFVKMAIEAHGGAIKVESTEGQGSSFRLSLPGTRTITSDKNLS